MPGRKILILFSAGFPILTNAELLPELTATIDACNKSNVTIYSVDVRALATSVPSGSALGPTNTSPRETQTSVAQERAKGNRPRLARTSYSLAFPDPQKPGGPGGATGVIQLDEFTQKGNSVVPLTLKLRVRDSPPGVYRLVLLAVDGANYQAPQKEIEFTVSD
jgi:hypothetical protein